MTAGVCCSLNATLSHPSVLQQHHGGFDRINFIVMFQREHLLVPHSGAVRWPSIHLAGLFIVFHNAVVQALGDTSQSKRINEKQKAALANHLNVFCG